MRLFFKHTLILGCTITALLASGCGKKSETEKSAGDSGRETVVALGERIDETVNEPVTIKWWHFWTDPTMRPVVEDMVARFEAANPNISVELTGLTWSDGHEKIVIALAAGNGPDLLELGSDWIPEFVDADQLADLTANLAETREEFTGWAPVTHDGLLYGRPWILGTRVMFYNTELIYRAGFDSGYIPLTLEDFSELAQKINALDPNIRGWGSNAAEKRRLYKKFLPFFWSMNGSLFSENNEYCVISSSEGGKALTYYKKLHDECGLVDTQRRLEDAFLDGKVGIVFSGDWLLRRIRTERPDFPFTTGLMPGAKLTGTSFLGGEYLVVNQDSPHKGAALKLLRFITAPENQIAFCKANYTATPSSAAATADPFFSDDPHMQTFIKQLRYAKAPPFEPTWVYIEEEIEKAVERTLFEDMGPFESLHLARNAIQKISREQ